MNIELLRSSFTLVAERNPELTHLFYDKLFAKHPEARPLFSRNSRDKQEKMLQGALVAVLDRLEDAPWLEETLGALGKKHVEYGVTAEMYGWVGGGDRGPRVDARARSGVDRSLRRDRDADAEALNARK